MLLQILSKYFSRPCVPFLVLFLWFQVKSNTNLDKWFSIPVKTCTLDSNSPISLSGEEGRAKWNGEAYVEGNLKECIPNNFGSWKEWDDADTLEMEVMD